MRHAIALGAIPVVVWLAWPSPQPPIVPKAVATEGITARRLDETTFSARWRSAIELPPATARAIVVAGGQTLAGVDRESMPASRPHRIVRRAALRGDVCARHGMRRVTVMRGRWQGWRCRR